MTVPANAEFRFPFRVRYSEVDAQGVVYNAHYLTYFDTAIAEYFRALPYDLGQQNTSGALYHTVRVEIDFHAPIYYDDEIEVSVRVGRLGRSSITFEAAILPRGENERLSSAKLIWVNVDEHSRRSAPAPPRLVELIRRRDGVEPE